VTTASAPKSTPAATLVPGAIFLALLALVHFHTGLLAALHLPAEWTRHLFLVLHTAAWIAGAWLLNGLVDLFVWELLLVRALRAQVPGALKALGALTIFLGTVTCIVGVVFERSVTGFLAALGAGSFVLGLALRNLFADIFTGLAVNLDRTFRIGDWIEVSDRTGTAVGRIEEIGWRSTHLHTEDHKTIVIPNSYLGIHRVTNVTRPVAVTRFQTRITIDFSVPVTRAKRVLLAALHAVHDVPGFVHEKHPPEVLAAEAGERGLEYLLRYWITPWTGISPNRARDVVTTSAMEHLRTAGITPAYEKTDIFHRDMPARNWEGHTREDQLALLTRLDLFSMLDRAEIEEVADSIARRSFHGGETVFAQGDPGDSLFVLTEGLLDVLVSTNGRESAQRVGRVQPGEFVGEMSLLTGEPRSATITAVTPCVAYEIGGDTLHRLLERRPEIATLLSQAVAERRHRNAETERRLGTTAPADAVASFASQLLSRMRDFLSVRRAS
jgi:small-conductance mechanosensitive channel/CRP-like cAMP-binding protein